MALAYHRAPPPGKLTVVATKPLGIRRDLALAYSSMKPDIVNSERIDLGFFIALGYPNRGLRFSTC